MIDANGRRVLTFTSALRNASRIGTYVDTVLDMFQSGAWRSYQIATGAERWRKREFDYFLIACDARYAEVAQLLTWKRAQAVAIAAAMEGGKRERRPLEQASREWHAPTGESLLDLARRNGWLNTHAKELTLRVAPVSQYTRVVARARPPRGGRARFYFTEQLKEQIKPARRRELDAVVTQLCRDLKPEECRYVRARLLPTGAGRPRLNGPVSRKTAWMRRQREAVHKLIN
jgi:hypothetical protein